MNPTSSPDTPTLTVAVATCGRPEALRICLASLASQTRRPDQVIVVDQAPLAETEKVIAECKIKVEYITQERLGLSASRNRALEHASESIFAVTDDDCFADVGWCHALFRAFAAEPDLIAVTGPILPPDGPPPAQMCALSLRPSRQTVTFNRRVPPWIVGSGANFACRRENLVAMGGWNERLGVGTAGLAAEDCEIIYRLLVAGHAVRYDGDVLVHHAWQTRERRRETRWTYGFGIGALSGTVLARRDPYGLRMLASYVRQHLRGIWREGRCGNFHAVQERLVALSSLPAGLLYGVRKGASQDDRSLPIRS